MAHFPDELRRFDVSTRCINMLRNSGLTSMEQVIEELAKPYPGGEGFFLRIPNAGRASVNELKLAADLWKSNNNRNIGTVALFTECLDRCLEAESQLAQFDIQGPKWNDALERRNRLRTTLIETIERMMP